MAIQVFFESTTPLLHLLGCLKIAGRTRSRAYLVAGAHAKLSARRLTCGCDRLHQSSLHGGSWACPLAWFASDKACAAVPTRCQTRCVDITAGLALIAQFAVCRVAVGAYYWALMIAAVWRLPAPRPGDHAGSVLL